MEILDRVLLLKGIDIFSDIPSEWLVPVAQLAAEASFEAGQPILREGEHGDCLYVIVEGDVRVERRGETVAMLHAGECVGEMSLLSAEPRSATVVALGDVLVLRIAQEEFYALLAERAEIARGLIGVLSRRLRDTMAAQAAERKRSA